MHASVKYYRQLFMHFLNDHYRNVADFEINIGRIYVQHEKLST